MRSLQFKNERRCGVSDKIFYEVYREAEQQLRDERDELIRRGEMSQEDADFRFLMVRDEILESLIASSD